ncbi:hypothetical protein LQL52_05780 [Shigella flexneri]|nr:hypothetical protein MBD68_05750 [Shigella flexneri]UUR18018.1 hypothetical protein LTE29_05800 [Shigella flexneri]UUR30484.1 hypothetical protein LQL52_05780 [Shigella flexneri]
MPGSDEETRADFENRRRNSVARNARNILEAIRGEILSTVENVVDVYVTHNPKKQNKKPESVSINTRFALCWRVRRQPGRYRGGHLA